MTNDIHAAAVSFSAKEADARRPEFERKRQVPPDLFRRAGDAGLYRQLICTELGGLGRSAVEWFRTGVEMARWEPSFSWVVTQGAGDHAAFAASGDPAFTSVFLADPNAYSTSSDNGDWHPGAGGWRISLGGPVGFLKLAAKVRPGLAD